MTYYFNDAREILNDAWTWFYCTLDDLVKKVKQYAKEKPKEAAINFFIILLLPIAAAAICGVETAREAMNAVFRMLMLLTACRMLGDVKRLRDALICVCLFMAIAVMLQHLGLASPNWLQDLWKWLRDPDYVGLCEKLTEWVFGPFWHDPADSTFWDPRHWMPR